MTADTPTKDPLVRAAFCQKEAAYRMEAYWLYRYRGEIEKAMDFHGYACAYYREARHLMGIETQNLEGSRDDRTHHG